LAITEMQTKGMATNAKGYWVTELRDPDKSTFPEQVRS